MLDFILAMLAIGLFVYLIPQIIIFCVFVGCLLLAIYTYLKEAFK